MTRRQQNRHSLVDDGLHAFDLTWRNYLPSVSTFCCFNRGNIRLEDEAEDTLIEPAYYNDHTLYRGEALQNYLDNSRDWEFDSVLGQNDDLPQFVTRNPFGTASIKKKKSKKSKKKRERPVVMETDLEEGDTVVGYDIEDNQAYYHDDAEFLGDDQIASLAYNRHSSQVMDQYGEELYYGHIQGPVIQEMQPPAPPTQFYAARSMPVINFEGEEDQQNYEDYEERVVTVPGPSVKPEASIEAAQALLSERLDDLTEKLAFIKNNIIHIKPPTKTQENDSDEEYDRNTLHTIKKHNEEEDAVDDQNSVSSADIDSITSEALNVYENTATTYENNAQSSRRYSTGDKLHIPSLVDNTPFVSDQHPFTYFTEQNNHHDNEQDNTDQPEPQEEGLNVRNIVFDFGKRWLGVSTSHDHTS